MLVKLCCTKHLRTCLPLGFYKTLTRESHLVRRTLAALAFGEKKWTLRLLIEVEAVEHVARRAISRGEGF
jgi:hypothetical protein